MSENTSGNNPGKRYEAFGAYYFRVDLYKPGTNDVMGSYPFRSCSGLKSEAAVVELEEGGFNGTTRKLIGRTKFPNIVLKQGLCTPNSDLWKLRQSYINDNAEQDLGSKKGRQTPNRISGMITQMGPNGAEAKWLFVSGWVCKWEGPDLDASKNEVSIESIEIAHEGLMMLPGKEAK
ncbi:MAG TPA: phage tail protein [Polyangia bacterium]|nr:phage tail protein [Polyangia bacterium]